MGVIQCESAEAALAVLDRMGDCLSMMFTDINLAGVIDGIELAHAAKARFPNLGRHLRHGAGEAPARRREIHAEALATARSAARGRAHADVIPPRVREGVALSGLLQFAMHR